MILVLPDTFPRQHSRYLLDMLFVKMGFKAILLHQEAVMATYSMAVQTGCVVDIGAQKISVSCVDDG